MQFFAQNSLQLLRWPDFLCEIENAGFKDDESGAYGLQVSEIRVRDRAIPPLAFSALTEQEKSVRCAWEQRLEFGKVLEIHGDDQV